MSNETCPHCGAEREMPYVLDYVRDKLEVPEFVCGNMKNIKTGKSSSYISPKCYERQIERLKQSVIDEREACAKLAEDFVETKKGWHTGDLVVAIRARGEVK